MNNLVSSYDSDNKVVLLSVNTEINIENKGEKGEICASLLLRIVRKFKTCVCSGNTAE